MARVGPQSHKKKIYISGLRCDLPCNVCMIREHAAATLLSTYIKTNLFTSEYVFFSTVFTRPHCFIPFSHSVNS